MSEFMGYAIVFCLGGMIGFLTAAVVSLREENADE